MYHPFEGGSSRIIQDLKVQIPKIPKRTEIQGYHLSKAKQKWKRTPLPSFLAHEIDIFSGEEYDSYQELSWEDSRREEVIKQTGYDPYDLDRTGQPKPVKSVDVDPHYICEPLDFFRRQELKKVIDGTWFYCYNPKEKKSEPTYITGMYYFYLNYWKMDTGYPEYRETDRDLFYCMEYVRQSPVDFGIVVIGKRGFGKSYIMGCASYYHAITTPRGHVGMQSKNDKAASELFTTKIAEPYKDLPDFLIPVNRNGNNPTSGMIFSPPSQKGRAGQLARKAQKEALRSKLDFQPSGEKAYDGTTLCFYGADEIGKTPPKIADVYERWLVVRQCVYRSSVKRGWSLQTTTVEKLEEGGEQTKKLWYTSDPTDRGGTGRTKSWMVRFFISAIDNSYFDEYGRADREKARLEHEAERESLKHDPNGLISYIQKNPFTIDEAFMTDGDKCVYNAQILQERQVFLSRPDYKGIRRGDFVWDIVDQKAVFVDNSRNGRWMVSWLFDDSKKANQVRRISTMSGYQFEPISEAHFAIGFDPISHKTVVADGKKSQAAAAVYKKYDAWAGEDYCHTFCADYLARPTDPETAYEDIIIAAYYFGTPVLIENNKNAAIQYFEKRGYSSFVMRRPQNTFTGKQTKYNNQDTTGIPSNTPVIEYYTDITSTYIVQHGHKLKHIRIVKDWLDFNPNKTTQYDSAVAASFSLVAATKKVEERRESMDLTSLIKIYNHSGKVAKQLN